MIRQLVFRISMINSGRSVKKTAAMIVLFVMISVFGGMIMPQRTLASRMDLVSLPVSLDGGPLVYLRAYESNYRHNVFVSLRELSKLLRGTASQFNFYNDEEGAFRVDTGISYDPSLEPELKDEEGNPVGFVPEEYGYMAEDAYWLKKNGENVSYNTYADYNIEDLYMSILDVQLMLDLNIELKDGTYHINSEKSCFFDLDELNRNGMFDYLHGVVLGDATTGEIFMSCHGDVSVPIASTTKLMTYFIVRTLMDQGKISEDDIVAVSKNAAHMAVADDGIIYLYEGQETTVRELIYAMMIMSSNECAMALAEYAAGSKEMFVDMMNAMAFRLGMSETRFYNPHGLPEYIGGSVPVMVENRASAADMFKLARAVLIKYPDIEEVATTKQIWLDHLWTDLYTTNTLLNNMPDLVGLKTGTTDAAGKCLVAARKVNIEGREHYIVSVVLGAEFNKDRVQISELLLKGAGFYYDVRESNYEDIQENTGQ